MWALRRIGSGVRNDMVVQVLSNLLKQVLLKVLSMGIIPFPVAPVTTATALLTSKMTDLITP